MRGISNRISNKLKDAVIRDITASVGTATHCLVAMKSDWWNLRLT